MAARKEMKKLSKLSDELADFQETLPDFCESVLSNGSRRGDEWDCADLENSPLTAGDRGSCSVNLSKGVFIDRNPEANPASGGMLDLWQAIFGGTKRKAMEDIKKWNADRTLPNGTHGVRSSRKVELDEGVIIEALNDDEYEKGQIKWIQTFQNWTASEEKHGISHDPNFWIGNQRAIDIDKDEHLAQTRKHHEMLTLWAIHNVYSRRWAWATDFTQSIRDEFATELAKFRGLSQEVFLWLIDQRELAQLYTRKELKDCNALGEQTIKVIERFEIAFPVRRAIPNDMIPHFTGQPPSRENPAPTPAILHSGGAHSLEESRRTQRMAL